MRNQESNSGRGDKIGAPHQCARTSFVAPKGNKTFILFLLTWSCNEEQMCDSYFFYLELNFIIGISYSQELQI